MKEKFKILLIILGIFIIFIGLTVFCSRPSKPDTFLIDGKQEKLYSGEKLIVDYWNDEEQKLDDKNIYGTVTIYKGIKIGSSKEKVIRRFKLNSKNTRYDCEVPNPAGDGTTDVIRGRFTKDIFKKDYLDCYLVFAYKDGKMLDYSKLENIEKDSLNSEGVVEYSIDINGFDTGEKVGSGEVIGFIVTKY